LQHYQLANTEKNKPSFEEAIARVKSKMYRFLQLTFLPGALCLINLHPL
jgi:hypothetical protein